MATNNDTNNTNIAYNGTPIVLVILTSPTFLSGVFGVFLLIGIVALLIVGKPVPDFLLTAFYGVLSFFFGVQVDKGKWER